MEQESIWQKEIENLLRQRIGLNPDSVGSRTVLRAVRKGMRQGRWSNLADYWAALKVDTDLFDALMESVVVLETSFFRNRVSYEFLRRWIASEWKPKMGSAANRRPLRVLSLPCSTGEEPYSIAIALLEEKLGPDGFHIDAVDISAAALEKARKGVYSPYAFRRQTYRKGDKYFSLAVPTGDPVKGLEICDLDNFTTETDRRKPVRYVLADLVREQVTFHPGNVLSAGLLANALPYDIVFCRNMLTYFDRAARDRTTDFINRMLQPDGLLFVGYAETSLIDLAQYQPVPYPQTFAFYKQSRHSRVKETSSALPSGLLPQQLQ